MTKQTSKPSPARQFADGQAVTFISNISRGNYGQVPGTIVGAMLTGVRHPGYIYDVRREDGNVAHVASGLITAVE